MKDKYKIEPNMCLKFYDDYKEYDLYRIRAIRRFGKVKKGELGGYIEPGSLSQEGMCWVDRDACIYNKSFISGNAFIGGYASISNTCVTDNAIIEGSAIIKNSIIKDSVTIRGASTIINSTIDKKSNIDNQTIEYYCPPPLNNI